MNKKNKKLTGVVTTGAIIFTLGVGAFSLSNTTAFAASVDDITTSQESSALGQRQRPELGQRPNMEEGVKEGRNINRGPGKELNFDALVEAGLLDATDIESIEAFIEAHKVVVEAQKALVKEMTSEERQAFFEEKKVEERPKLFDELVTEGILTQDQVDAIRDFQLVERQETMTTRLTEKLSTLVTDGTLDESDVAAIIDFMIAFKPEEKVSPVDEMVAQSIITEDQGSAIKEVLNHGQKGRGQGVRGHGFRGIEKSDAEVVGIDAI